MIVKKTLNILENSFGKIFILNNKVITHNKKHGYLKPICNITNSEKDGIIRLLKRSNRTVSTSWIDYMKYDVEIALENLNAEHYYKYHERSRDLDDEDDKFYYVSVFLDNHDWEHFENFEIPKSEISRDELDGYLGVLC